MFPWKESVWAGVVAAVLGAPTIVRSLPAETPLRLQPERPAETRPVPPQHLPVERGQPGPADATPRDEQARHLFRVAERCRGVGDFDKARVCYEEAHLISPSSRCGQLAIARLRQLERGWLRKDADNAEEQDLTSPRRTFRDTVETQRSTRTLSAPVNRDRSNTRDDALRRQEMLRKTEQLDTLREGLSSASELLNRILRQAVAVRGFVDESGAATGLPQPGFQNHGGHSTWTGIALAPKSIGSECLGWLDEANWAPAQPVVIKNGQFVLLPTNSRATAACASWRSQGPCVIVDRELLESWRRDCNFLYPVNAHQDIVVHHLHPDGSVDATPPPSLLGSVSMMLLVLPSHPHRTSMEEQVLSPTFVSGNGPDLLRSHSEHLATTSETAKRAERTKSIAAAMLAAAESLPEVRQEMMSLVFYRSDSEPLAESIRSSCARLKLAETIHHALANSDFPEFSSLTLSSSLSWSNSNGTIRVYDNSTALRSQLSSLSVMLVIQPSSVLLVPQQQKQRDLESFDIAISAESLLR